jgi:hypothetical protein
MSVEHRDPGLGYDLGLWNPWHRVGLQKTPPLGRNVYHSSAHRTYNDLQYWNPHAEMWVSKCKLQYLRVQGTSDAGIQANHFANRLNRT